jgi:hypothetical protein
MNARRNQMSLITMGMKDKKQEDGTEKINLDKKPM